jgi:hypothetical protein
MLDERGLEFVGGRRARAGGQCQSAGEG